MQLQLCAVCRVYKYECSAAEKHNWEANLFRFLFTVAFLGIQQYMAVKERPCRIFSAAVVQPIPVVCQLPRKKHKVQVYRYLVNPSLRKWSNYTALYSTSKWCVPMTWDAVLLLGRKEATKRNGHFVLHRPHDAVCISYFRVLLDAHTFTLLTLQVRSSRPLIRGRPTASLCW